MEEIMPVIIPIRDLRKTTEISELAHKTREPIFVTRNGYSDLVVMSSETYDRFAQIERVDDIIRNAEIEAANGAELITVDQAFDMLDKKYYG